MDERTWPPGVPPHEHGNLERAIGKLEGEVSGLRSDFTVMRTETRSGFTEVKEQIRSLVKVDANHNGNISKLQQWRMDVLGGIGVAVFLVYLGLQIYSTFVK